MRYLPGRRIRAAALVVVLGLVATGIAYAAIPSSTVTHAAPAGGGSSFHYKIVTHTESGNRFSLIRTLTAKCPEGSVVLGGGGKYGPRGLIIARAAADWQVIDSYPEGQTGWTAVFYQTARTGAGYVATVWAICAELT